MTLKRSILAAFWVLSLIVAAQWATRAQGQNAEVRFRIDGVQAGKAFGTFFVNQNGTWIEVGPGPARAQPAAR